jgi:hypothetical protein
MQVTREHVDHWREHGYALVPELLSREEVAAARRDVDALLDGLTIDAHNDGVSDEFRFPFAHSALNKIVEHPQILSFRHDALPGGAPRRRLSRRQPHDRAGEYGAVVVAAPLDDAA